MDAFRLCTAAAALMAALTVTPVSLGAEPARGAQPDRVLIVVSGAGRERGKTHPGYEMDELAQAWHIFRDNGLSVEIASPQGGAVEADGYDPETSFNARLLADGKAMAQIADTRRIDALRAEDYAAVYVVGGKGAMFDLPRDPALPGLIGRIYDRGGVVAAVCHGPAALAEVRLADGRHLIAGRAMTGFSNEEEAVFGKKWIKQYPFMLEDAMRQRGALWQEAPLMMPKLVVDGRLITGQNPYSTTAVAEAIVRATGRTPAARIPDRDERSMALVERLLRGEADAAKRALAGDPNAHHVQLIGLLGYYQLQAAADNKAVRDAVAIMTLALPHFDEPKLKLGIAEGQWRLGQAEDARKTVRDVLAAHPEMEEATALMARFGP